MPPVRTASPAPWYEHSIRVQSQRKNSTHRISTNDEFTLLSQGARGLPGERGRPGAPGPAVSSAPYPLEEILPLVLSIRLFGLLPTFVSSS